MMISLNRPCLCLQNGVVLFWQEAPVDCYLLFEYFRFIDVVVVVVVNKKAGASLYGF
jgi:hypothetical protein